MPDALTHSIPSAFELQKALCFFSLFTDSYCEPRSCSPMLGWRMVAAIVALQHEEVGTVLNPENAHDRNFSHTDSTVLANRETVVLMSKEDDCKHVSLKAKWTNKWNDETHGNLTFNNKSPHFLKLLALIGNVQMMENTNNQQQVTSVLIKLKWDLSLGSIYLWRYIWWMQILFTFTASLLDEQFRIECCAYKHGIKNVTCKLLPGRWNRKCIYTSPSSDARTA